MATSLTQTTLSAALAANATVLNVASATGISGPTNNFLQQLYVINPNQTKGELMIVSAVSGTAITVQRLGEFRQAFLSGATVLVNPIDPTLGGGFFEYDPTGAPTTNPVLYTPWVNIVNGNQWIYSTLTNQWVPGWNNPSAVDGPTAVVASTAGPVTPSGRLFHISGNSAITGFTKPVGFAGGTFDVIPDGTFTWTTGDGSIALAGTAVVNKTLTFTYDSSVSKWTPSYVA